MRDGELERLGEMRKRTEEEEEGEARKVKQRRRSGVDALDWLKGKKTKILKKVKEQEMKDKREERVYFILLAVFFFQLA